MTVDEYQPGGRVPRRGRYQEVNVLGTPTGKVALMMEGDEFPDAPNGFGWRLLSERSAAELRAKAADYRRMADTARTVEVTTRLRKIADQFDALAEQREREAKGGA